MSGKVEKKKSRRAISLETKLYILERFEAGERAVKIAKALGLAESTVKTIRDRDGSKIKEIGKATTVSDAKKITRARDFLLVKMESLLSLWIKKQVRDQVPPTKSLIQEKAKQLYAELAKQSMPNDMENENADKRQPKFSASQGWFERFKARQNLHNVTLKAKAASSDSVGDMSEVCRELANLPKENLKLEKMDENDVKDSINNDLMELGLELVYKKNSLDNLMVASEPKMLTPKHISKAMVLLDKVASIFTQNDPDEKRSSNVARSLFDAVTCYKIYLEQKQKTIQQTLETYFQSSATAAHRTIAASSDIESPLTLDSNSS